MIVMPLMDNNGQKNSNNMTTSDHINKKNTYETTYF